MLIKVNNHLVEGLVDMKASMFVMAVRIIQELGIMHLMIGLESYKIVSKVDTSPHSLKDSNANPKVETTEKRIGVRSLVCNTSGVEMHVGALGWESGRMTSESIIHTNLHKPNKELVSVWLEHF
jgi:hypothetical protein